MTDNSWTKPSCRHGRQHLFQLTFFFIPSGEGVGDLSCYFILPSDQGDVVVEYCNGCTMLLLGECAPLVLISGVHKNRGYEFTISISANCTDVDFAVVDGGSI